MPYGVFFREAGGATAVSATAMSQNVTVGHDSPLESYAYTSGNAYEGAFSFYTTVR